MQEDGFPIKPNSLSSLDEFSLREKKRQFAYALLKNPSSCFEAASAVFPLDPSTALKISNIWPNDIDVVRYQHEILEQQGQEEFLPTKVDFLKKIWERMEQPYPLTDNDDFVKLANLYAKSRGFIEENKKDSGNTFNIGESAKVMIVTNAGTDAEWQQKAMENQQKLLANGN